MVLGCWATAVTAHEAALIKSVPANGETLAEAPAVVTAWFAEELVSGESNMTVFDGQGNQVDNGGGGVDLNDPEHASMIVTLPSLPDGAYTVQWHAVLIDGDATDGAFAFAIGEGQTAAQPTVPAAPQAEQARPASGVWIGIASFFFVLLLAGGLVLRQRQTQRDTKTE